MRAPVCRFQLTSFVLVVVIVMATVYMLIEALADTNMTLLVVRGALILLGVIVLLSLRGGFAQNHFQLFVFLTFLIGGVAKTVSIDQSGSFGQTLFQLGILLVLRINFVNAVVLSLADLTLYCIYAGLKTDADLATFLQTLVFLLGFAISGCYRLQVRVPQAPAVPGLSACVGGASVRGSWGVDRGVRYELPSLARARCLLRVTLLLVLFTPLKRQLAMREDFLQDRRLEYEQHKSNAILDNLLPTHVSAALMNPERKGQVFVQYEKTVSVLFCDIMGFSDLVATVSGGLGPMWLSLCLCVQPAQAVVAPTPCFVGFVAASAVAACPSPSSPSLGACACVLVTCACLGCFHLLACQHTPKQLVQLLDSIYSLFDVLCMKHGVTKMETVGKTYMAASGLQGDRTDHAQALVLLGLDMIHTMRKVHTRNGRQVVHVRVGINSGSVISGVVGRKKQQFSLFGDCVNTASRMQSCAGMDEIRVSKSTMELLKESVHAAHFEVVIKVACGGVRVRNAPAHPRLVWGRRGGGAAKPPQVRRVPATARAWLRAPTGPRAWVATRSEGVASC